MAEKISTTSSHAKAISSKTENLKVKVGEGQGPALKVTSSIGAKKRGATIGNARSPQKVHGQKQANHLNNALLIQANEVTLSRPLGG